MSFWTCPRTVNLKSQNNECRILQKKLIDLRADIAKERERKKKDNENYARLIKGASTPSSKASYRKQKIDKAAYHDRQIESLKRQVESAKESLARERARK